MRPLTVLDASTVASMRPALAERQRLAEPVLREGPRAVLADLLLVERAHQLGARPRRDVDAELRRIGGEVAALGDLVAGEQPDARRHPPGRGHLVARGEVDAGLVAARRELRLRGQRQLARRPSACRPASAAAIAVAAVEAAVGRASWTPAKIVPASRRYSSRASPAVRSPGPTSCVWYQPVPVRLSDRSARARPSIAELARARLDQVLLADAEVRILLARIERAGRRRGRDARPRPGRRCRRDRPPRPPPASSPRSSVPRRQLGASRPPRAPSPRPRSRRGSRSRQARPGADPPGDARRRRRACSRGRPRSRTRRR